MLFDTDVLIWVLRGNSKAADIVDGDDRRAVSVITTLELLQGSRDKREMRVIREFLGESDFRSLPLTENIGHRAMIYMEEYRLARGMQFADALQAATAVEYGMTLCTGNRKHYVAIKDLDLRVFRP